MDQSEEAVATALLDAQEKAQTLFEEIEAQKLIRPGVAETEINESILALAGSVHEERRTLPGLSGAIQPQMSQSLSLFRGPAGC